MTSRVFFSFVLGTLLGGWLSFRYLGRTSTAACVAEAPARVSAPAVSVRPVLASAAPVAPSGVTRRAPERPRALAPPPERTDERDPRDEIVETRRDRSCPQSSIEFRTANPSETTLICQCSNAATEEGAVWGSGTYTGDSSICRAARHAGYWRADGDEVRVYLREGQAHYEGTESLGVQTQSFGAFETSFSFR